ncbi:uncharacterized protein PV06_05973 [Exophiala oligosperma]|uniref:Uncharacterized protein n=1 Tax=Exophiala oligosperma TaxID=215243 RepID=A0A0D2DHE9_9EURO|nr:uncharacterized protein PV06_05973 [Exophiala oligosperma]KIW42418.1 hypothetical protein PV06_05973 [Exophiala oligosperma]
MEDQSSINEHAGHAERLCENPGPSGTATPTLMNAMSPKEPSSTLQVEHGRQSTPSRPLMTATSEQVLEGRVFHPDASIILIGIRASGKRSLGFIAATALGRRFITEDHYFQSFNGLSRQEYLRVHGSEQFHRQDIATSKQMLEENKYGCVIDCGLGSLTSSLQDYLRQLSQTNPVIFILRDMDRIQGLLKLDERSAKLLENGNSTHRKCSNYEYFNLEDESMARSTESDDADRASPNYSFRLRHAQADFSSFVRLITGTRAQQSSNDSPFSLAVPVEQRTYTYAIEVKLSNYMDGQIDFAALESAGDVTEIYVDVWNSTATRALSKLVGMARRTLDLPILLSVTATLADASSNTYLNIIKHGFRLGVEYLSVNLELDDHTLAHIKAMKGYTKLVATYAPRSSTKQGWKDPIWRTMLNRAVAEGFNMIRFLNVPQSRLDNDSIIWFSEEMKDLQSKLVISAFNVGALGRTSQILNPILTSVTHASLPRPLMLQFQPLLSSKEIIGALFDIHVFDSLKFYVLGANVSGSLSPSMHNAAYEFHGLRHTCITMNITSWQDAEELAKDDSLCGLSIVQPYKVRIFPHLSSCSGHARAIGAVNTIVPLRADTSGKVPSVQIQAQERNRAGPIKDWYGENTDFRGIMTCINRSLSPRNSIQPKSTALVVGAGGMARAAVYAMLQLGCKNIFIYNRTLPNTKAVADHFNGWARSQAKVNGAEFTPSDPVKVLKSTSEDWPGGFSPPTIVVSCVTHELLDGKPGADFELPESWMQSPSGGVILEMAYMTKETPLVKQMRSFRESTGRPWVIVGGIEALIEQATVQFETLTGRKAPKRCMAKAAWDAIQKNTSYLVDGEEYFSDRGAG